MKLIEKIELPELKEKTRLSDALIDSFQAIPTRKGIKKAIQKGLVQVNGKVGKTGDYVFGGETVELFQRSGKKDKQGIFLKLDILFEDDYLAIINKPSGIVVNGNQKRTIRNALNKSLKKSEALDALRKPEPVHRLDYATSGILVISKTHNTLVQLSKLFENREIDKTYIAIVKGNTEQSGKIESEIKGKKATTYFTKKKDIPSNKYGALSLVELKPISGRRHQLRIHMNELGHPIIGDQKYHGNQDIKQVKGLHLHASTISFKHPMTDEELKIEAPLPKKFNNWL